MMRRHSRRDLLLQVQALDEDQEGNTLVLKKLFEEDREFNQGAAHYVFPFAEEFRFHCSNGFPCIFSVPPLFHVVPPSMFYVPNARGQPRCCCAGEFAEAVREQFMTERAEALARLEQALLDATLQAPDCTRDRLAQALMALDPDLTQAQVHCCSPSMKCSVPHVIPLPFLGDGPFVCIPCWHAHMCGSKYMHAIIIWCRRQRC